MTTSVTLLVLLAITLLMLANLVLLWRTLANQNETQKRLALTLADQNETLMKSNQSLLNQVRTMDPMTLATLNQVTAYSQDFPSDPYVPTDDESEAERYAQMVLNGTQTLNPITEKELASDFNDAGWV